MPKELHHNIYMETRNEVCLFQHGMFYQILSGTDFRKPISQALPAMEPLSFGLLYERSNYSSNQVSYLSYAKRIKECIMTRKT